MLPGCADRSLLLGRFDHAERCEDLDMRQNMSLRLGEPQDDVIWNGGFLKIPGYLCYLDLELLRFPRICVGGKSAKLSFKEWLSGSVRIRVSTGLRYVKPENVVSLKLALYARLSVVLVTAWPRSLTGHCLKTSSLGARGAQTVTFVVYRRLTPRMVN